MKQTILTICIALCSLIITAQSKVGTIDVNYILSKMPEIENLQKELESYGATLDKQLEEKMKKYQTKLDDYNANVSTFTEQQMQERQNIIFTLEDDITKFRQNGIQLMRLREDELKRPLYVQIAEALDIIANAQHFTQILDTSQDGSVVFLNPEYDVTLSVMTQMGIEAD